MTAPERYTAADHPLARLHECGLDKYFRREHTVITCPLCRVHLDVYVHKETLDKAFFLCRECAWFHARPVLFTLLQKAERPDFVPDNSRLCDKQMRRIAGTLYSAVQARNYRYRNLSGGKRHAKPQQ